MKKFIVVCLCFTFVITIVFSEPMNFQIQRQLQLIAKNQQMDANVVMEGLIKYDQYKEWKKRYDYEKSSPEAYFWIFLLSGLWLWAKGEEPEADEAGEIVAKTVAVLLIPLYFLGVKSCRERVKKLEEEGRQKGFLK